MVWVLLALPVTPALSSPHVPINKCAPSNNPAGLEVDTPNSGDNECDLGSGAACVFVDNTGEVYPGEPTSWIQCDLDLACGSNAATAYLTKNGTSDEWALWGSCASTGDTFCCSFPETVDASVYYPHAVGMVGTTANDNLFLISTAEGTQMDFAHQTPFVGRVSGGEGDDTITGSDRNNGSYLETLRGQDDNDVIWGGNGDDTIYGGAGNDVLRGEQDEDTIYGDAGNDVLAGYNAVDTLYGGDDQDLVCDGDLEVDTPNHSCTDGALETYLCDDESVGANDFLWGDGGNDCLIATNGADDLHGGIGNDQLVGGLGNDELRGASGNDNLSGGDDEDLLCDSSGTGDVLSGGDDDDQLAAGGTSPSIDCGAGSGDESWPSGSNCETVHTGDLPEYCEE